MKDLRFRFGFVLALALLPLLIFSLIQAVNTYTENDKDQQRTARAIAVNAADNIIDRIDTAYAVMRTLDMPKQAQNCSDDFTRLADKFPTIDYLAMASPKGEILCASAAFPEGTFIDLKNKKLTPQSPLYVKTNIRNLSGAPQKAIEAIYGVYDNSALAAVYFTGHYVSDLPYLSTDEQLDDTHVAILNQNGEVLFDTHNITADFISAGLDIKNPGSSPVSAVFSKAGKAYNLQAFKTFDSNIHVLVKNKRAEFLSWQFLNPFTSGILPILAWAFAFTALWIATDQMILAHLRKIQVATIRFARGHTDARVGDMPSAPEQIEKLAHTFDLMAKRISSREDDLLDSVNEKETLLREIHHRVKNNLQIIISLLNMQERKLNDGEAKTAIQDAKSRINAISLVHRALYETEELREIDMPVFLGQLTEDLSRALAMKKLNIETEISIQNKSVAPDTAIPMALFLVEAITNAVKHGVSTGGKISVALWQEQDTIHLSVRDNGGVSAGLSVIDGTGNKLMSGFARQLLGEFKSGQDDEGYFAELAFPANQA